MMHLDVSMLSLLGFFELDEEAEVCGRLLHVLHGLVELGARLVQAIRCLIHSLARRMHERTCIHMNTQT